jgi:hypothetical protein
MREPRDRGAASTVRLTYALFVIRTGRFGRAAGEQGLCTDLTGRTYNAYQVIGDPNGNALTETFDLDNGGRTLLALRERADAWPASATTRRPRGPSRERCHRLERYERRHGLAASVESANFTALTNAAPQSGGSVVINA